MRVPEFFSTRWRRESADIVIMMTCSGRVDTTTNLGRAATGARRQNRAAPAS